MKIYPKVYHSNKKQTVFLQIEKAEEKITIKIQGMEYYTIPHSPLYRIDEEERYPFVEMKKCGDDLYSVEYEFRQEQKYSVTVMVGAEVRLKTYLYAVDDDLAPLYPFKGDTHLHSNHSDGEGTPFEVGCNYRKAGYDFIAITDHHIMYPSVEGMSAFKPLTDTFTVFQAEEVHNRAMGYFHIINFGGTVSVNEPILANPDAIEEKVQAILASRDFTGVADPYACAYRIFVAEEIRKVGGLAIMAHPYWDCYGEYNAQTENVRYLWKNGCYDALELLAGCDWSGNGNNLQLALWADLRAEGVKIPVVGASDSHSCTATDSLFNKQFSIVFAKDADDIKNAIVAERSVAIDRRTDADFYAFGKYRYVKYARFIMEEYAPAYNRLAADHAAALSLSNGERTPSIALAEDRILAYKREFFATLSQD